MQQSTNYNMNKPDLTDQYDLAHWNQNIDIIDTELKKREDDDTALKNPAYTVPASDANLVSGEGFQTAFGKIAKAISSFITHKGTTTSVHGSTPDATASKIVERDANGRAKIATASLLSEIPQFSQISAEILSGRYWGVKVVAESNITLYGEQIIDGVSCKIGDVVLVTNQINGTENGIYIVQSGAWSRHLYYDYPLQMNHTYLGVLEGSKKGYLYKARTDTWVEGTTVLNYISSNFPVQDKFNLFFRRKINACEEFRPPIGIPFFWMADKPSWAIDFGNGASTKYLWANYPELNNDMFKSILTKHYNAGSCQNYDSNGFYVPDLRGLVPIGHSTNGVRTGETYAGGTVGEFKASQTKYHNHGWTGTASTGAIKGSGDRTAFEGGTGVFSPYTGNVCGTGATSSTAPSGYYQMNFSMTPNGTVGYNGSAKQASKPGTFAGMWIVRFE